jgi:prepilin-type N-terminal cleavage/methylation domain-containing protein
MKVPSLSSSPSSGPLSGPSSGPQRLAPRLAWLLLRPARRSGFTLIESLVAIIIVAIVVIGIIPPVFYATATRVQNRRAEQAAQLAQTEIDKVRAAVEQHASYTANGVQDLPPFIGADIHVATNVPAPDLKGTAATKVRSVNGTCQNDDGKALASVNQYIAVDTDGGDNCKPEFFVQIFRSNDIVQSGALPGTPPDGFFIGVRVYSAVAANTSQADLNKPENLRAAPLRGGQGLGFQAQRPMAVLYSSVVRSDRAVDVYKLLCTKDRQKTGC